MTNSDDKVRSLAYANGWENSVPTNVQDMPTPEQHEAALERRRMRDAELAEIGRLRSLDGIMDREGWRASQRTVERGGMMMTPSDAVRFDEQKMSVRPTFSGPIGKNMMIKQGYVPPTCSLDDEIAGPLIFALVNDGKDPCAGCNSDRPICRGRGRSER